MTANEGTGGLLALQKLGLVGVGVVENEGNAVAQVLRHLQCCLGADAVRAVDDERRWFRLGGLTKR